MARFRNAKLDFVFHAFIGLQSRQKSGVAQFTARHQRRATRFQTANVFAGAHHFPLREIGKLRRAITYVTAKT